MPPAVLLYDGSRPAFRAVAEAATRHADLVAVPLGAPAAEQFLDAQFGRQPFVFVLVEDESVHVGSATVERVLRRRGLPFASLAGCAYPRLAGPVGRLVHGREPASIDGTQPLRDAARKYVDQMRDGVAIPVDDEPEATG